MLKYSVYLKCCCADPIICGMGRYQLQAACIAAADCESCVDSSTLRVVCVSCRRLELLKPLTHHDNTQYLRLVLVVAAVFVLIVAYTFMALNWSNKTASGSNSVQRALENMGIVKPKARKLL